MKFNSNCRDEEKGGKTGPGSCGSKTPKQTKTNFRVMKLGTWKVVGPDNKIYNISFKSESEAKKYAEQLVNKQDIVKLTSDQQNVLRGYMDSDYTNINKVLSGKEINSIAKAETISKIKIMDEILLSSNLPESTIVYSGLSTTGSKRFTNSNIGDIFTIPTFVSTSRNKDIAETFVLTKNDPNEIQNSVILKISLEKGIHAIDVESFFNQEKEIIVNRGYKYKIQNIKNGSNNNPKIIELKILKDSI